jgi:hypothetical protein
MASNGALKDARILQKVTSSKSHLFQELKNTLISR